MFEAAKATGFVGGFAVRSDDPCRVQISDGLGYYNGLRFTDGAEVDLAACISGRYYVYVGVSGWCVETTIPTHALPFCAVDISDNRVIDVQSIARHSAAYVCSHGYDRQLTTIHPASLYDTSLPVHVERVATLERLGGKWVRTTIMSSKPIDIPSGAFQPIIIRNKRLNGNDLGVVIEYSNVQLTRIEQ